MTSKSPIWLRCTECKSMIPVVSDKHESDLLDESTWKEATLSVRDELVEAAISGELQTCRYCGEKWETLVIAPLPLGYSLPVLAALRTIDYRLLPPNYRVERKPDAC